MTSITVVELTAATIAAGIVGYIGYLFGALHQRTRRREAQVAGMNALIEHHQQVRNGRQEEAV